MGCKNRPKTVTRGCARMTRTRERDRNKHIYLEGKKKMNLIEQHWEYTLATARAHAVEICQYLDKMQDFQDVVQELLIFANDRIDKFNAARSQPKTFISMLLKYARKQYLRRAYRHCRRTTIEAVDLDEYKDSLVYEHDNRTEYIIEFITAIEDEETRSICQQTIIDGIPAGKVGMKMHKTKQMILDIVRQAMKPLADDFGFGQQADENKEATEPKPT